VLVGHYTHPLFFQTFPYPKGYPTCIYFRRLHAPEGYYPEGYYPEGYYPEGYYPEGYYPEGYPTPKDILPIGYENTVSKPPPKI
jgi:hypothetical protein